MVTESRIDVPVYLNNSYDYNPLNEDYVSKIINRDKFLSINGSLGYVSAEVSTEWKYNWSATVELNKEYRFIEDNEILDENPITSDPSKLNIEVKNDYFKWGIKYVFDLEIYSRNGNFSTNHTHTYILIMNDYPFVNEINILPKTGYISNLFLITINKCKDDVSDKSKLRYQFTYFKKYEFHIEGFVNKTDNEQIIQSWSSKSEVLYQFPELPEENDTFYIRGFCRDEFGVFYSHVEKIKIYDIPTNSGVNNIHLDEGLTSID